MKYPQLVSMPSAVQDWLDEQLEARGIDAVVYTRYVVSLLQRDSLDLALSPTKVKEVGRRGRSQGRQRGRRDAWDCERLKRSAAVECLMSASDQKCGIEKLVDELCAKLKEIQSEGESGNQVSVAPSQLTISQSPQDQAQKYYAAFPPLSSRSTDQSESVITLIPDHYSAWSGKKVLADSFGKNKPPEAETEDGSVRNLSLAEDDKENHSQLLLWKEVGRGNMKSRPRQLSSSRAKKDASYGFAWTMSGERNSDTFVELGSDHPGDTSDMDDMDGRRLYERQSEDSNLAQLIAKFDHSIEAIWSPEEGSPSGEMVPPSPKQPVLTVELYNLNNKRSLEPSSFIQCGTNITNSIWSDHPSKDDSFEQEDHRMEYTLGEQQNESECYSDIGGKELENCLDEVNSNISGKFEVLLVGDGKIVGNRFNNSDKIIGSKSEEIAKSDSNAKHEDNRKLTDEILEDKSKISWNKLESFPSFFTSLPWGGQNYSGGGSIQNNCNHKWSDAENTNILGNFSPYNVFTGSYYHPNKMNRQSTSHVDGKGSSSFTALNHNREDSSFMEVIPKQNVPESMVDGTELCALQLDDETECLGYGQTKNDSENMESLGDKEKEEEDLLTSTRTHFRPIRQDSQYAGSYADGTTFAIPNSLETVAFTRSASGTLYLECGTEAETPHKYMEFKEKENDPNGIEFIPKFRVHQIEKCCQTEEAEEMVTSDEEIGPKRSRQDPRIRSGPDDFYFPGDDHFAEKILDCINEDGRNEDKCQSGRRNKLQGSEALGWTAALKSCCKCNNNNLLAWKNGWLKTSKRGQSDGSDIWEPEDPGKECHLSQSWYDIWSSGPEGRCPDCPCSPVANSVQYSRLRDELSRDGEQLMSDLSYLQHLYLGSDWLDDADWGQKLQCLSPPAEQPQELLLYDDTGHSHSVKSADEFASACSPNTPPKPLLLSTELEAEWKLNERPFIGKTAQKDRKRRHSASQRTCHLLEGGCRRPHELSAIPCRFWADASCLKGGARALRPVTL